MRWLRDLLARLPDDSHVLDLGCGSGVPATQEIARRHKTVGVDISARQIEMARSNVPAADFVLSDVLALEFASGSFDAVVSFYAFDHVPRERQSELLARAHGWLRAGGYLLFSAESEDRPGSVGRWLGVPMFLNSFDASTTRRIVEEAGFRVVRAEVESQIEAGTEVSYVWILARKTTHERTPAG